MNRVAAVVLGAVLGLAVAAVAVAAVLADEPDSAFHDVDGTLLVDDDTTQRDVRRLALGAAGAANEPALADSVLLVLHADEPYGGEDVDAFDAYLRAGGTAVVLDTRGHGTQLTAPHGITFERVRLHQPGGAFDVTVGETTLRISAADASALLVEDPDVEILAHSTADSHLDRDGGGDIDQADPNGPFPVVARAAVGDGVLWAIAAPAAFDPAAEHLLDEAAFRDHVLGDATTVLVDEGRTPTDDPTILAARLFNAAGGDPWRWLLPLAAVLALAAASLPAIVRGLAPHRFDPRTLLPRLRDRETRNEEAQSGFTSRGRIALAAGTALLLLGVAFRSPQAAWASIILLVPGLAALFVGPPSATAVRTVSTKRIPEGSPVRVGLRVQFRGSRAGVVVQDELPGFFDAEPAPVIHPDRRSVELDYTVRPARMGRYDVGPLRAERSDPLGMRVQVSTLLAGNDLRVTPRLEGTRDAPFKTRVPQIISGQHQVNRAGGGTEFLALREYQTGDTLRMVNWKASARAKNLMVNQRVHETPLTLTVILDARSLSDWGPADNTPFVRGARSAASIAQETIAGRDKCQIIVYGDGIQRIDGRGADVLHRFQEHMADARAAGDTPLAPVVEELKTDLRSGQPVVYVGGGDGDDTLEASLETLRRRGSPVHVVMPMIEDTGDGDSRSAARAQRELAARLRSRGFPLYELEPGRRLEDAWRILEAPA